MHIVRHRAMGILVTAIGLMGLSPLPAFAQQGHFSAQGTETRQLDRAIHKTRALHARPHVSHHAIVLALTDRVNAQEGTRYTPGQVIEMLNIDPMQMGMLQRGVGLDHVVIRRAPAFHPAPAQSVPAQHSRDNTPEGGLVLNTRVTRPE